MRLRTANGKTQNVLSTANPYESPEKPRRHAVAQIVTVGVVLLIAAVFAGRYLRRIWIIDSLAVVDAARIEIAAPLSGRLSAVFVKENQRVRPGDLVARFSDPSLEAERRAADSAIAMARSRLDIALRNEPAPVVSPAEIAAARAQVDECDVAIRAAMNDEAAAQASLESAMSRRRRIESLVLDKAATVSEVDPAARDEAAARTAVVSAKGEVERLLAKRKGSLAAIAALEDKATGPVFKEALRRRDTEIAECRRLISEAEEARHRVDVRLAELEVRAERNGIVVNPPRHPGEVLAAGEPIVTLRDLVDPWVDLYVRVDRASIVFPGSKVDLTAKGFGSIRGVVDSFYPDVDVLPSPLRNPDRPQDRYARAKLRIDGGNVLGLSPGQVLQAKVIRAEH
ncbi:MAG: HlyD family efflux transporter periplasmic adaptor subunit [Planctomycetes bacterium]|nr:HlyD family efflux transporter periplasmic adaptor subunit [Planctomycetota bacterium]MBI3844226.1 HlyD family efflux transporter periplasmic adaptor subunit [Planctomycetota bacterium]